MDTTARLSGLHPDLQRKTRLILQAMETLGFPMMVTDGLRTAEQQAELFAKGRKTPGPVVTYMDGVKKVSQHQPKTDGFGHAIDCAFLVDGKPSWDTRLPWNLYGAMGKALGLAWGGDWKMRDMPHLELP